MSARISTSAHVVTAIRGGSTVLLDQKGGRYYTLEEVGTEVWQLLAGSDGITRAQIIDTLATRYDAPVEVLTSDVGSFIAELARAGLVEVR